MMLLKLCLFSIMRIFAYILDISRDMRLYVGSTVVFFKACINYVLFFMLNVRIWCRGGVVNWLMCVCVCVDTYLLAYSMEQSP